MAVYTVFEPPLEDDDAARRATKFAFVRDGFTWGAFIFDILWMLWHRLWLVAFLFAVVFGAMAAIASTARLPTGVMFVIWLLVKFLIGLEAATLRRWTLQRRRWRELGSVVADNLQTAERRFFDHWVGAQVLTGAVSFRAPTQTYAQAADTGHDIIGLFPQPGGPR